MIIKENIFPHLRSSVPTIRGVLQLRRCFSSNIEVVFERLPLEVRSVKCLWEVQKSKRSLFVRDWHSRAQCNWKSTLQFPSGKDPASKLDYFFGKVPKIYVVDFGNFKQGFLSMKLIKRRVSSGFRVCFFNNCIDINWY